jgi:hypothetical protein
MIEKLIIITNNPLSKENFTERYDVIYIDGNVRKVYEKVRDMIHLGHEILTHPLMSSVKPNETPYRTVCVSQNKKVKCDVESLMLIEGATATLEKFLKMAPIPEYSDEVMKDFQVIDYDLINHALS